jgi:hypothetical protein
MKINLRLNENPMLSNSIGKARGAEVGPHVWSQNADILYVFRL